MATTRAKPTTTRQPAKAKASVAELREKQSKLGQASHVNHDTAFGRFARRVAGASGHPAAFISAFALVIIWGVTGPLFDYSETWQLVINTGTTIITFLMVFVIQNTQNKDTDAMQIKLDELIRANSHAHNAIICLQDLSHEEVTRIRERYLQLAEEAREDLRAGTVDENKPDAKELFNLHIDKDQRS